MIEISLSRIFDDRIRDQLKMRVLFIDKAYFSYSEFCILKINIILFLASNVIFNRALVEFPSLNSGNPFHFKIINIFAKNSPI